MERGDWVAPSPPMPRWPHRHFGFGFFCTNEELQVVKLRQKSLIWNTRSTHKVWHHPKSCHQTQVRMEQPPYYPKIPFL